MKDSLKMKQFKDEVHDYQSFIVDNFKKIGKNYEIIQEQFAINNGIIDILAYNNKNKNFVIIELKNIKVNESIISQVDRYYQAVTNLKIDDYFIQHNPEIIVIAPEFKEDFSLSYKLPIKLLQIYKDNKKVICKKHKINYIKKVSIKRVQTVKKKKTIFISEKQKYITDNLIKLIKSFYKEELSILDKNDHIDIIDKKIIIKIIFPKRWFVETITVNLYKNFIKPFTVNNFISDPTIKTVTQLKNVIKLSIYDIPQFFKEKEKIYD